MVVVKAFKGLRPRKELVETVSSPPYDVLSSDEARSAVANNPNSLLYVTKSEISLPKNTPAYSDEIYAKAKQNLQWLIAEKVMVQDERDAIYIYRLTWRGHSQVGFMLLSSVEDYFQGRIKRHEFTRPDKENDRTKLNEVTGSQTGPVFLFYSQSDELLSVLETISKQTAEYDFVADEVRNEFWVVNDAAQVAKIVDAFAKVEATYIADGHHRCAAAANACKNKRFLQSGFDSNASFNFFLTVVFPADQLRILPYYRVIVDFNGLAKESFLTRIGDRFEVSKSEGNSTIQPEREAEFGMYLDHTWYRLIPKAGSYDRFNAIARLGISILQNNLLDPILGITKPRTDKRIDFVGGIRGTSELVKLVDSGRFVVAFSVPAVTLDQLKQVADSGEVMPPKSTWFEPKLRDGLAVHLL